MTLEELSICDLLRNPISAVSTPTGLRNSTNKTCFKHCSTSTRLSLRLYLKGFTSNSTCLQTSAKKQPVLLRFLQKIVSELILQDPGDSSSVDFKAIFCICNVMSIKVCKIMHTLPNFKNKVHLCVYLEKCCRMRHILILSSKSSLGLTEIDLLFSRFGCLCFLPISR